MRQTLPSCSVQDSLPQFWQHLEPPDGVLTAAAALVGGAGAAKLEVCLAGGAATETAMAVWLVQVHTSFSEAEALRKGMGLGVSGEGLPRPWPEPCQA